MDYDLHFGTNKEGSQDVKPFLLSSKGEVAFLKVYLLPFAQFEKLICYHTGCLPFLLPDKLAKGQVISLNFVGPDSFYNTLVKLGSLEHLDILALNRTERIFFKEPTII